ncbi:hypothetical protein QN400_23325, partial [Pseudomonas sp. RTC3]|nr:hypothetical protein [Pseudomonas sp. RTC3]MEB0243681.1 hypothetical protein [Pseudomonas sp. 5C2]
MQVLRAHRDAELAVSLEVEKKGFRKPGDVGRVFYVDQKNPATHSILLSKISDPAFCKVVVASAVFYAAIFSVGNSLS